MVRLPALCEISPHHTISAHGAHLLENQVIATREAREHPEVKSLGRFTRTVYTVERRPSRNDRDVQNKVHRIHANACNSPKLFAESKTAGATSMQIK